MQVIERDELQRQLHDGDPPQLVEVLPAREYQWAHLPGAVNVPLTRIGASPPTGLDPARPVITYCNDFL
jgi:rhodanese-related sulfurtransferase